MPVFHIREGASIISLSAARPGRWPALVHMNECISFKFLNDRSRKAFIPYFWFEVLQRRQLAQRYSMAPQPAYQCVRLCPTEQCTLMYTLIEFTRWIQHFPETRLQLTERMDCLYVINNLFFILVDWCLYERSVQPSAEEHVILRGEREMVSPELSSLDPDTVCNNSMPHHLQEEGCYVAVFRADNINTHHQLKFKPGSVKKEATQSLDSGYGRSVTSSLQESITISSQIPATLHSPPPATAGVASKGSSLVTTSTKYSLPYAGLGGRLGHTPRPTQVKTDDIKWKEKTLNISCIAEESNQESELPNKELQSSRVFTHTTPTLLAVSSPSTDSGFSTAVVYHDEVIPMSQVTKLFTSVKNIDSYSPTHDQIGGSKKEGMSPESWRLKESGISTESKHDDNSPTRDSGGKSCKNKPEQQLVSGGGEHPVNEGMQSGSTLLVEGHQEGLAGMQDCASPPGHNDDNESKKTDTIEETAGTQQQTPSQNVSESSMSSQPSRQAMGDSRPASVTTIAPEQAIFEDEGELLVSPNPLHSHIKHKEPITGEHAAMTTTGHTFTIQALNYPVKLSPSYPASLMKEKDHLHQGIKIREEPKPLVKRADQYTIVEGGRKLGYIVYSCLDVILQGTYLPLPSQAALDDGIGRGGNGTITNIYFKGKEFAVKKTHFRQIEVDVMSSLRSEFVLSLEAVMMGEEDPLRPHRYYCYHFYPRMSGDVQTYLNRLGQGALSNVLMKHKDSPSMLQLVVDNVKHILRCVLEGIHYLHSNDIVHNDIKPSNFLVSSPCGCDSPITCNHSQTFGIKIGDFDSAMPVAKLQTSPSLVRQLYRTHPIGTPGYRPVEYVLAGTRSVEELRRDVVTSADLWSFGCSTLKMFISHSGPSSQQEMSFLHLWGTCSYPWSVEDKRAKETLKVGLLKRVYPSWSQLWEFVEDCMKIVPTDRTRADELLQHQFFSS